MSPLKNTLTEAMKDAMRAKEKFRLGVIRMALAEIKRVEVDERIDVDDARCLAISFTDSRCPMAPFCWSRYTA